MKTFHLLVRCTSQKVCLCFFPEELWEKLLLQPGEEEETAQIGSDISAWDTSQKFQLLTCEMEKLKETTVVLFTKTKMLAWGAITQLLMRNMEVQNHCCRVQNDVDCKRVRMR